MHLSHSRTHSCALNTKERGSRTVKCVPHVVPRKHKAPFRGAHRQLFDRSMRGKISIFILFTRPSLQKGGSYAPYKASASLQCTVYSFLQNSGSYAPYKTSESLPYTDSPLRTLPDEPTLALFQLTHTSPCSYILYCARRHQIGCTVTQSTTNALFSGHPALLLQQPHQSTPLARASGKTLLRPDVWHLATNRTLMLVDSVATAGNTHRRPPH